MKEPIPVCTTMLPRWVREQMAEALAIDPHRPPGESLDRTRALESVIFRARAQHPKLFKRY